MDQILQWLSRYGMGAMYGAVYLEAACFPLPSEAVLPLAGAMAAQRGTPFLTCLIAATLCSLAGCLSCYIAGRTTGASVLQWGCRRFPQLQKGLDASQALFDQYGGAAVFFGRMIPLCRTYISFASGLLKQKPLPFLLYSGGGILVWNAVLLGAGYVLKGNWARVEGFYSQYKTLALAMACAALLAAGVLKLRKSKKNANNC